MSDLTKFNAATKIVLHTEISYPRGTFPITHQGQGVFKFANGHEGSFHELGAGYLSERLPQYKHRLFTAMVRDERWDDLAETANKHLAQLQGEFILPTYDGKIVGVLRNYNPVRHVDLMGAISAAGLAQCMISHNMTTTHLEMYLRIDGKASDAKVPNVLAAMQILNGHSGHYALRYRVILLAEGYEWEHKINQDRRRHLSKVNEVVDSLTEMAGLIMNLRLDDHLMHRTAKHCITRIKTLVPNLSIRQERLLGLVETAEIENGLELVAMLGGYSQTAGYHSAVDGLLSPFLSEITSDLVSMNAMIAEQLKNDAS